MYTCIDYSRTKQFQQKCNIESDYWSTIMSVEWVEHRWMQKQKRKNAQNCSCFKEKASNCTVNTSKTCVYHTSLTTNKILFSRYIKYSTSPFMLGCTQRLSCFSSRANSQHWNHVGDLLHRLVILCVHTQAFISCMHYISTGMRLNMANRYYLCCIILINTLPINLTTDITAVYFQPLMCHIETES